MEPRTEYRNGVMYVVYEDGEAIPLAEVMKYNNPSTDFDPATGDALGPAAPPAGLTEANIRAQAAMEPERLRDQDTFGDTAMYMAQPYIDSAVDLASNAGRRPTYFTDPVLGGAERVGQYVGDMGMAALSGVGAAAYGGAGLLGDIFGGSENRERMLARDLAAGIDVSGIGPEARALGLLSDAVRAGRGGAGNMARGFLASDPATERGAQIIDMLTSGRADEITDEMLDMGDPVLNANLGQYLYRNYDLPMDQASRMERAAKSGFNVSAYRGTMSDESSARKPKVFVSENPDVVQSYAGHISFADEIGLPPELAQAEGGNIIPLLVNPLENSSIAKGYELHLPANQIRSRFARFDPRLAHLRNLSAGIIPFGLLSMPSNEEQY